MRTATRRGRLQAWARGGVLLIAVLGASAPSEIAAQPGGTDDERARSHFLAATSYLEQHRYAEAAAQFEEAFRLSGRIELLVNLSTCYERMNDMARAAESLEAYLGRAPADDPRRRTFEGRLAALQAAAARQAPEAARASAEESVVPREEPAAIEVDTPPEPASPWLRVAFASSAGAGVALGVVAIATGIAANGKYAEVERACGGDLTCPIEIEDEARAARRLARTSLGTAVVGAGALAAGAILLFVELRRGRTSSDGGPIVLAPGPGELGLSIRRSF